MSEYWKSTPKYWCKHCKTHVRDTPLEKRNHEATPRHQGNISRFLRDLHRANEREARDVQRGKDEAMRLNGLHPTAASGSVAGASTSTRSSEPKANATPQDRQRQLAQLAALGVAVPEEYRVTNAMPGEWQSTEVRPPGWQPSARKPLGERISKVKQEVKQEVKEEETDETQDLAIAASDTRKRSLDDEDADSGLKRKKPNWGTDLKSIRGNTDDGLEALLGSTSKLTKERADIESKQVILDLDHHGTGRDGGLKQEDVESLVSDIPQVAEMIKDSAPVNVQSDEDDIDISSIFKKRKTKSKQ